MGATILNWPLLVQQNRARAVGVPWSDDDLRALNEFKIPADVVRQGVQTLEVYEQFLKKESASDSSPLYRLKKEELIARAAALAVPILDAEAMTRVDLMDLIRIEEAKHADAADRPLGPPNVERAALA